MKNYKKKLSPQELFILERVKIGKTITNWHLNDTFLDFGAKFYKEESIRKCQRKFRYYANKLVQKGYLHKARRAALGPGGYSEFGTRTQTIWDVNKEKCIRLFDED